MKSKFSINNNLKRLKLHDSGVLKFYKNEEGTIIEFDWSFLENFVENGIDEGIVLGKTKMSIKDYKNEKFRLDYSGTVDYKKKESEIINYNENLFDDWDVILENSVDENIREIKISGFYEKNGIFCWIDWTFEFETIEISWEKYILHKEWLNGQIITEK